MNTEAPRHTDPTKDISYSPWSHKESYTTETHTHTHTDTHTQGRCHPGSEGKLEVSLVVEGLQIKPQRQRIADIFF